MIVWSKTLVDGIQRSDTPRGYSIGMKLEGFASATLTAFYGEAGFPIDFIGERRHLARGNNTILKKAGDELRGLCNEHHEKRQLSGK